ncbi:MAG: MBL fold metallo-hydrolase [Planctomycetota bacterium]|jgi:L-ascorbate metabolism protein UlaG (beta-lactamase superfamily)|nr:MBL fold metallo-hydrolase [Planctomycetota bacterium]
MAAIETKTERVAGPLFECLAHIPQRGTINLFWLGQAGFALRSAAGLVVVDPYLSNSLAEKYRDACFKHKRMMPAPIGPDELRGVDLLLATHAHSDHLDPGSVGIIMALNPNCSLVSPIRIRPIALERGADPDRTVGMKTMEIRRFGQISLEILPSAHEKVDIDDEGNTLFGGFVITMENVCIYHSGDCVPFESLAGMLRERGVDMALLPVNGRDAERRSRGVPGNFTVEEAAGLCLDAEIGILVPHHFGMFDFNTVPPESIRSDLEKYAGTNLRWFVSGTAEYLSVFAK